MFSNDEQFASVMDMVFGPNSSLAKMDATPPHTVSVARREELHQAAIKRRKKRKRGGPK